MREVPGAEWDALLARLGAEDAYARRGYLEASRVLTPGEPVLLHETGPGGDVVLPLLVREDPADATTPYGYGGPVAVGPAPPLAEFWAGYEEWARARGVVSTFAVLHPVLGNRALVPGAWDVRPLGDTIAWRLTGGDPFERLHPHHRRLVRRAERAGARGRVEATVALGDFPGLYAETMTRNEASPFYFFGADYWAALAAGAPLARVDVHREEELLASVLLLVSPPGIHYHLGASAEAGRALGASHLALLAAARWGSEQGGETLHLGGGVGGREDGLLSWKERFDPGGRRGSFTARRVHLPERYAELTGGADPHAGGFFPAYRAARA